MTGQCSQCGALLQAGTRFCGTCGAAAGVAPKPAGSATAAWAVAVIAVGLLGAALTYIYVSGDDDRGANAEIGASAAAVPSAEPPAAAIAKPDETPASTAPAPAIAPAPLPAPTVPARVGNGAGGAALIGSYRAYIGSADLYASDGVRLTRPWQVLRQDRANVHRFGIVDAGDEGDPFFASANARAVMERMVMSGSIEPAAGRRIVAGGVMVSVSIYGRGSNGDYVDVRVE